MNALSGVSGQPHSIHNAQTAKTESGRELPAAGEAAATSAESARNAVEFRHELPKSPGRYWLEPTAGGHAVRFQPPTVVGSGPDAGDAGPAPNEEREAARRTRCSTDAVDREIAELRRQVSRMEQQLQQAGPAQQASLQKDLEATKRELALKDNDAYRRQRAVFTDVD